MNFRRLVITGPIGSGKSTISKLLEGFGALRVDLDQLSREVLESPGGVAFVAGNWPETVCDGTIDRTALADRVFSDRSELGKLEGFVHPQAIALYEVRFGDKPNQVVEVSVPRLMGRIGGFALVVDSPTDLRIARLIERGMEIADIRLRMTNQLPREGWLALAEAVIVNGPDLSIVRAAARKFWSWWTSGSS